MFWIQIFLILTLTIIHWGTITRDVWCSLLSPLKSKGFILCPSIFMGLFTIPIPFFFRNRCWTNNSVQLGFLYPFHQNISYILWTANQTQFGYIWCSILKFRKIFNFFYWIYYLPASINWKEASNEACSDKHLNRIYWWHLSCICQRTFQNHHTDFEYCLRVSRYLSLFS